MPRKPSEIGLTTLMAAVAVGVAAYEYSHSEDEFKGRCSKADERVIDTSLLFILEHTDAIHTKLEAVGLTGDWLDDDIDFGEYCFDSHVYDGRLLLTEDAIALSRRAIQIDTCDVVNVLAHEMAHRHYGWSSAHFSIGDWELDPKAKALHVGLAAEAVCAENRPNLYYHD